MGGMLHGIGHAGAHEGERRRADDEPSQAAHELPLSNAESGKPNPLGVGRRLLRGNFPCRHPVATALK
jgi:hypothetical protein